MSTYYKESKVLCGLKFKCFQLSQQNVHFISELIPFFLVSLLCAHLYTYHLKESRNLRKPGITASFSFFLMAEMTRSATSLGFSVGTHLRTWIQKRLLGI